MASPNSRSQTNSSLTGESSTAASGESIPRGLLGKGGTPVSKSTRLPSVKPVRDLTLGGTLRKTFKPNIPVRPRDKPGTSGPIEDKMVWKSRPVKKEKTERPVSNPKGRFKGQSTIIQSQSIFESGPTERTIKRESIYGGGEGGGGSGGSSRGSTSVNIKNMRQTKAETQELLDQLLRDDFIDGEDSGDITDQPITLPLLNTKQYKEIIKTELKIDDKSSVDPTDPSLSAHLVDHTDESLKMMLVQLPDCLPGLVGGDDDRPRHHAKVKQEPTIPTTQPAASEEPGLSEKLSSHCKLSDLSEGKIGKLQVLASGKTRLVLGDVMFDVSRGAPSGFLQELICMDTDGDRGQMICLGPVREKLVVVPNISTLLNS